jgi:hypothetical protein
MLKEQREQLEQVSCAFMLGVSFYVAWQYWLYLHLQAKTEKARIREENDRIKKKERELKEAEKERKRIEALGVYYCTFTSHWTDNYCLAHTNS